jgi:hypothetical protein
MQPADALLLDCVETGSRQRRPLGDTRGTQLSAGRRGLTE